MQLNKFNFLVNSNTITSPYTVLCKYAGFDIDKMLENNNAIIFGGALRDIAADECDLISDIDVLCESDCIETIKNFLLKQRYIQFDLYKKSLLDLQACDHIDQILTFIKRDKTIQLIRMSNSMHSYLAEHLYSQCRLDRLLQFVTETDFSCCGLAYHPKMQLKAMIVDAFEACVTRTIYTMPRGFLYDCDRACARMKKLTSRGWEIGDVKKITDDDINSMQNNIKNEDKFDFDEDLPF